MRAMKSTGKMFFAAIQNSRQKWSVRNRVIGSNGWLKTTYNYHTINHVTYDIP